MNEPTNNHGKRGQPTKLDERLAVRLLQFVADGRPIIASCKAVGIDYSTLRKWLVAGRNGDPHYVDFFHAYTQADGSAEIALLDKWSTHFDKDYRSIRDYMAVRWPKRYGKVATTNLNVSGQINHEHVHKLGKPQQDQDYKRIVDYLLRPELEEPTIEAEFEELQSDGQNPE